MDSKLSQEIRELLDQGHSPWSVSMILDVPRDWVYAAESDEESTVDKTDLY